MGYKVKCFDTRYSPVAEYFRMDQQTATNLAWTTMDYPSDWAAVAMATAQGANPGVPRVFVADGGSDGAHLNVVQLEAPATYTDTPASAAAAVAVTPLWVSKQFNMSAENRPMAGRDKRVHLWGCKIRNPVTPSSPTGSNVTTAIYTSGSPTVDTSTAAQVVTTPLSSTTSGNDWGVTPQSGNDITEIRTEGVEQLRSELFQMSITHSTSGAALSDFRIVEAELYWTMAG